MCTNPLLFLASPFTTDMTPPLYTDQNRLHHNSDNCAGGDCRAFALPRFVFLNDCHEFHAY
ncbi:hypothetical protein BDN72DRAFT_431082 [Pluteus cervinus]|uniref:Uncharacterized protein n=1 Tax=Pluteus cervinus TaxID=181527 RepID=A0ACD3A7T7_9AGAR|nr:hypothetical protein BDN72DRAFT_431082 [Pluteus cervinus]